MKDTTGDVPGTWASHVGRQGYRMSTDLAERLSGPIDAMERDHDFHGVLALGLKADEAVLQTVARSSHTSLPDDYPKEIPFRVPGGPIFGHAMSGEAKVLDVDRRPVRGRDGELLAPFGDRVLLRPLTGKRGLHCWEELACLRTDCAAYGTRSTPCWLISGTLCRDGEPRAREAKTDRCLQCPAFGVVGILLMGVPADVEAEDLIRNKSLAALVDHVAVVVECFQSAKALLGFKADLESLVQASVKELAKTKEELIRSRTLAAIGRLAAGLAREINDPLGVISNCVTSLALDSDEDSPTRRPLEIISIEVDRMSTLVRGLMDLSRQQPLELADAEIGAIIAEAMELTASEAERSDVVFSVVREGDDFNARVDRNQIHQAFISLLMNAIQAMAGGGRLVVSVRATPAEAVGGRMIEVVFKDNGPGMSPGVLPRVFDPFFTTKMFSGALGLGLSISLSIVERHGGTIVAESTMGEGSAFIVRLPSA